MKTKNIWHAGAWAENYGDRVLQFAMQDIVRERSKHNINFKSINIQKTWFSSYLIDKMNKEADMLLIGGGGLMFFRPQDRSNSGWQFNIKLKDICKIDIPIVVYGIGYNQFPHDIYKFPKYTWETIQEVINKSVFFSVRNKGTYNTLKDVGLDVSKVKIVPDAAIFAKSHDFSHPVFGNKRLKIGLNWASDRWLLRFGLGEKARGALDITLKAIREEAVKHNAIVYLIEHLMPNDLNRIAKGYIRRRFNEIFDSNNGCCLYDKIREEMYPPFDYLAPMFVDIYKKMNLAIGMRGHACLIPMGQGVPVIGLGEHNKIRWTLNDMGQDDKLIKLNNIDDTDYDCVRDMINKVLSKSDDIKNAMCVQKINYKIVKDKFIDNMLKECL